MSCVSASVGSLLRPVSSTKKPRIALAQEKAIHAKVSAKKLANRICSEVTFTGLITSYIFQVPKAVRAADAPKTKARATSTSRPLPTPPGRPLQDFRSCTGMASGASGVW